MNNADRIATVAELSGLSRADAEKGTDASFAAVTSALKDGDDVRLIGFRAFSVLARPAREGRNPQTGKTIQIAANRRPKLWAGKALKDALHG